MSDGFCADAYVIFIEENKILLQVLLLGISERSQSLVLWILFCSGVLYLGINAYSYWA